MRKMIMPAKLRLLMRIARNKTICLAGLVLGENSRKDASGIVSTKKSPLWGFFY